MNNENDILASSGPSAAREAKSVRQSPRFPKGAEVEVLNELTKEWAPAVVMMSWAQVQIPTGERDFSYDVDGVDSGGAFWGCFDSAHVRERQLPTVEKSQSDASQHPGEAKP